MLRARPVATGLLVAMLAATAGCNGLPSTKESAAETPTGAPQTYMAPVVGNVGGVTSQLEIFTFDDTATPATYSQATSALMHGSQTQINDSGQIAPLARGLLALDTTYQFPAGQGGPGTGVSGTTYSTTNPLTGSWAVELPDKTGGLVELVSLPAKTLTGTTLPAVTLPPTPLVAAVCPTSATAQTYQFLTIPNALRIPAEGTPPTAILTWNPIAETAYGSVSISASGTTVNLTNISQNNFIGAPVVAPTTPAAAGASGVTASPTPICYPSLYGNTISVPGQVVITNPGNGEVVPASATIGLSSSGLLVEDNGVTTNTPYQNSLGAGTGAIGILKPSSAVDPGSFVGAQYNGFFFGSGNNVQSSNYSSSVASFGFSSVPASCALVTTPTPTLIYGGDFTNNDPSDPTVQSGGGFGNCDYAIDLGPQDGANNGLFPAAKIWVGSNLPSNKTGASYSFPAIAIAGQVGGKHAIFVLGVDTTGTPNQAEIIYLLQSN